MKATLQKLCDEFISNRDAVAKAFKWDMSNIYPVCANIFSSHGRVTDVEQLKQCRKVIEDSVGILSNFRGSIKPVLAAMLALGDDPKAQMEQAKDYYGILKQEFWGSEYLALVSFILTNLADRQLVQEKLTRGKAIYKRMKQEHPFLTGSEDSVFAVLMAFADKSDDELIADMEESYATLKERFSIGDQLQTVSHVLSMTDGSPREKAQRLIDLFNALREGGVKYGRYHELAVLAALSLTETDIPTLVGEIKEADAFLKEQKGYGILGIGHRQRAMNAAMIVSDQYTADQSVNTAAIASTIAMIIAQEIAMCSIAASSAAAASHS